MWWIKRNIREVVVFFVGVLMVLLWRDGGDAFVQLAAGEDAKLALFFLLLLGCSLGFAAILSISKGFLKPQKRIDVGLEALSCYAWVAVLLCLGAFYLALKKMYLTLTISALLVVGALFVLRHFQNMPKNFDNHRKGGERK